MMRATVLLSVLSVACVDLGGDSGGGLFSKSDIDYTGAFSPQYAAKWQVTVDGDAVAEVAPSEDVTLDVGGVSVPLSAFCTDKEAACHGEGLWSSVFVDLPYGDNHPLVNWVNLDETPGHAGDRMGGILSDGALDVVLGAHHFAGAICEDSVSRQILVDFNDDASALRNGVVVTTFAAGCAMGDVTLPLDVAIETHFRAAREDGLSLDDVSEDDEGPVNGDGGVIGD